MSKVPTKIQISAGGVAFRKRGRQTEVALISVGDDARWQLPKGVVDSGETTEAAAVREVREEAGINTRVIDRIDKVEYWRRRRSWSARYSVPKYRVGQV